jgi:hypothetical protein
LSTAVELVFVSQYLANTYNRLLRRRTSLLSKFRIYMRKGCYIIRVSWYRLISICGSRTHSLKDIILVSVEESCFLSALPTNSNHRPVTRIQSDPRLVILLFLVYTLRIVSNGIMPEIRHDPVVLILNSYFSSSAHYSFLNTGRKNVIPLKYHLAK